MWFIPPILEPNRHDGSGDGLGFHLVLDGIQWDPPFAGVLVCFFIRSVGQFLGIGHFSRAPPNDNHHLRRRHPQDPERYAHRSYGLRAPKE